MSHVTPDQFGLIFKVGGAAIFIVFAVASITQQSRRNAALVANWQALAGETGGTYTVEKRAAMNSVEWVGGPTVKWTIRGVPATLSSYRRGKNSSGTRLTASFRLDRPLQFHLMTKGPLASIAASPRLWNMVIASAEKQAEKKVGTDENAGAALEAIHGLRYMTAEPVQTGSEFLDQKFILKSDDGDRARDVLTDSSVSYWLEELTKTQKNWSFVLSTTPIAGKTGASLDLAGQVMDLPTLRAARSLVEGTIGRLADRGIVADTGRPAA